MEAEQSGARLRVFMTAYRANRKDSDVDELRGACPERRPWRGRCSGPGMDLVALRGAVLLVLAGCHGNPVARADAAAISYVDAVAGDGASDAGPATPHEGPTVRVSAPYAAVVRRVDAAPGAPVVRGARIALLAPVGGLVPEVAKEEAELLAAEHDLARQEDLHARGEPQRDVDEALDRVRVARARAARAAAAWAAHADAGAPLHLADDASGG